MICDWATDLTEDFFSVEFHKFLGLSQINQLERPESKFSLYFLACDGPKSLAGSRHSTDRSGVVELTHNYGTEDDPSHIVALTISQYPWTTLNSRARTQDMYSRRS